MRSKLFVFLAVLLSATGASTSATLSAAMPTIYNLGTLGDFSGSSGSAINNSGQVAGVWWSPDSGGGFLYTGTPGSGGVMHDLVVARTFDINESGQVAGISSTGHAFVYSGTPGAGGVMHKLGTLGGTGSQAYGINDSGQVTGASDIAGDTNGHAFLYTGTPDSGGVMHDLGTLGGPGTGSVGRGINNSGQVTGQSVTDNYNVHAFLYTGTPGAGGVMHDLGTLDGGDGPDSNSVGYDVNDLGQVTGWSGHAFLYSSRPGGRGRGEMLDLGTLGGPVSWGEDINNSSQIVGSSYVTDDPLSVRAFLYTGRPGVDGVMINLDTWLDVTNPAEGAKWTLWHGMGLSENGLITGEGLYDDGPGGLSDGVRAYVLDASDLFLSPDYNHDGVVNALDYVVWRKSSGTRLGYNAWRKIFGRTAESSAIGLAVHGAVPEPSGLAIFAFAVPLLVCHRRIRICSSASLAPTTVAT